MKLNFTSITSISVPKGAFDRYQRSFKKCIFPGQFWGNELSFAVHFHAMEPYPPTEMLQLIKVI